MTCLFLSYHTAHIVSHRSIYCNCQAIRALALASIVALGGYRRAAVALILSNSVRVKRIPGRLD